MRGRLGSSLIKVDEVWAMVRYWSSASGARVGVTSVRGVMAFTVIARLGSSIDKLVTGEPMYRDNMVVECILDIRRLIRDAPQPCEICVVLGKQQIWLHRVFLAFCNIVDRLAVGPDRGRGWETIQVGLSELVMNGGNPVVCGRRQTRAWLRRGVPGPRVWKPELRDDMQTGGVRTTIICGDANVNVIGTILVLCVLRREFDEIDGTCRRAQYSLRQKRPSNGLRRRHRCQVSRTQQPRDRDVDFRERDLHTDRPFAGTCTKISCMSELAWNPGSNTAP